jgi:hypothetical protein
MFPCLAATTSARTQQGGLLLLGEAYSKTLIVKINDGLEIFGKPVVEIRGTRGKRANDGAFEAARCVSISP